uniref:Uncharacterized protein n=1 Tax=Leersia perrieri TaxID=77586 RepID=A0A0D9UYR4_9ORYZ
MCMEGGKARRGGKKAAAAEKVAKQPQRGLGVAQLEKIRLHNQMLAALRSASSGAGAGIHDDTPSPPFAGAAASPFHYHLPLQADCYEAAADRRRMAGVQPYYEGMLPYGSGGRVAAPAFVAYDQVKGGDHHQQYGSPGQRQQQPQYYTWMSSGYDVDCSGGRSSAGSSSEELDLELRL